MSSFTFKCPHCNQKIEAQDEWRGQQANCPTCNIEIMIPAIELSQSIVLESRPVRTESDYVKKHLSYASLALQSNSFAEAEKEFQAVLQDDPDHYVALYGVMLSKAYQTSPENPSLGHIIYSYRKIDQILTDSGVLPEKNVELRQKFIGDFASFIADEYHRIFAALQSNKRATEVRDAVNTLNAVNRGIVLANPEAAHQQEQNKVLFPYLKEIIKTRLFIILLIDISELADRPELLCKCKKLFEATLNISDEDASTKEKYNALLNAIREQNIQQLMTTENLSRSEAEARWTIAIREELKKNVPRQKIPWIGLVGMIIFIICLISSGSFFVSLIAAAVLTFFVWIFWAMIILIFLPPVR